MEVVMEKKIQMVDLKGQYYRDKESFDRAIADVLESSAFINGPQVKEFADALAGYLGVRHVITCANGTDALQIALMALGLKPGDEVIVPSFTYIASAEVISLLGLTPVMTDVDADSFEITAANIEKALSPKTKAIIPVHLYGRCCDMEAVMQVARRENLFVIEDNAQSIGGRITCSDSRVVSAGCFGDFGCTSFFPSKNLGCYGDGGALYTDNDELARKAAMIANHGQQKKYVHTVTGCNSRLDSIQAAVLNVKLRHLDEYIERRRMAASYYDRHLSDIPQIIVPKESPTGSHVYHQYTLRVLDGMRDSLKEYLASKGIPSMVYYPLPLDRQEAFASVSRIAEPLDTATMLCGQVLSLPMHTELCEEELEYIVSAIKEFFNGKR